MNGFLKLLATGFGLGYIPYITGSVGTLAAIPIFLGIAYWRASLYFLTLMTFTTLAVWVSQLTLPLFQDPKKPQDPSHIVIDEVVGFLWALGIVRYAGFWAPKEGLFWLLLIPYVFFRLFDITKWGLVGWAERKWVGAVGIVLDDLFAGILAGIGSILFCIVYPLLIYAVRSIVYGSL